MNTLPSLCFILLFLFTNSSPCSAAEHETAVLDLNGEELKVGSQYYVVSAIRGAGGGGVMLSRYPNRECPITISQNQLDVFRGAPCSFHPANSIESVIQVSKSVNIKFEIPIKCANSTVWQVGHLDAYTRSKLVEIQGELGNPGCGTVNNWFKIEKGLSPNGYEFVFNPDNVCSDSTERYNVGIAHAFGQRPLVLSHGFSPFHVTFVKHEADGFNGNMAYAQ